MPPFVEDADYRDDLREPFAPEQVGKLPRIWCGKCRDASPSGVCTDHSKAKCRECDNNMTTAHLHLDFVGHANVTDRLNHVAPDWSYTVDHIETVQGHVLGVLGTMTIGGKSVHEAGAVSKPGQWGEELKLAVSDFVTRGAMRFGVGLDMWIKGDAAKYEQDVEAGTSEQPVAAGGGQPDNTASADVTNRGGKQLDRGSPTTGVEPGDTHPASMNSQEPDVAVDPPATPGKPGDDAVAPTPLSGATAPPGTSSAETLAFGEGAAAPVETAEGGPVGTTPAGPSAPVRDPNERATKEQLDRLAVSYGGQAKAIRAAWAMFSVTSRELPSIATLSFAQAERLLLEAVGA